VPTRQQALSAYRESEDYRAVGRALGVPAGQAYLVATGLPADGGDTVPPGEAARPGALPGSTQLAEDLDQAARKHVAFEDPVLQALTAATSEQQRSAVGKRFLRAHSRPRRGRTRTLPSIRRRRSRRPARRPRCWTTRGTRRAAARPTGAGGPNASHRQPRAPAAAAAPWAANARARKKS
jgi:hypothetical protein